MERFIALFLSWSLFETWSFPSKSQLDDVLLRVVARALAAYLNDSLHIAPFGTNESPGHLELLVVVNLNVKPASVLDVVILILRIICCVGSLRSCLILLLLLLSWWCWLLKLRLALSLTPLIGGGINRCLEELVIHVLEAEMRLHCWLLLLLSYWWHPLGVTIWLLLLLLLRIVVVIQHVWLILLDCCLSLCTFISQDQLSFPRWLLITAAGNSLLDDPFHGEWGVVLIEVEVVKWLLCHEGGHNISKLH